MLLVIQNKELVMEIQPYTPMGAAGKIYESLWALHLGLDPMLQ